MATSSTVFGYWEFKGKSEPIRLLLAYTGIPFECKVVEG